MKSIRIIHLILLFLLASTILLFCNGNDVLANDERSMQLEKNEVVFNLYDEYSETITVTGCDIKSVTSSDPSIVTCTFEESSMGYYYMDNYYCDYTIYLEAAMKKLGTAIVTVTDVNGNSQTIKVTVKCNFELNLNHITISKSYKNYFHLNSSNYQINGIASDVIYPRVPFDEYGNIALSEGISNGETIYDNVVYSTNYPYGEDYHNLYWMSANYITNAVSRNPSIVKIDGVGNDEAWSIVPVSVGTATIDCYNAFGQKASFTVTVAKNYINSYIKAKTSIPSSVKYGSSSVTVRTIKGAKVTVLYGRKKYKATAKAGKCSFKIPIKKIGTSINYIVSYGGGSYTFCDEIMEPKTTVSVPKIYRPTRKAIITVKNAHKGDVVTFKIGKDSYKKTVKKGTGKFKFTVKFKKTYKEKTKFSATVKNKFKQKLATKSGKVYFANKIRRGMTKQQCKLVPGWEYPSSTTVSGNYTTWWYDDGSYLTFNNGLLYGWHM